MPVWGNRAPASSRQESGGACLQVNGSAAAYATNELVTGTAREGHGQGRTVKDTWTGSPTVPPLHLLHFMIVLNYVPTI